MRNATLKRQLGFLNRIRNTTKSNGNITLELTNGSISISNATHDNVPLEVFNRTLEDYASLNLTHTELHDLIEMLQDIEAQLKEPNEVGRYKRTFAS